MATFIVQEVFIRDSETTGPQRNVQYDIILSYDEVKVKVSSVPLRVRDSLSIYFFPVGNKELR